MDKTTEPVVCTANVYKRVSKYLAVGVVVLLLSSCCFGSYHENREKKLAPSRLSWLCAAVSSFSPPEGICVSKIKKMRSLQFHSVAFEQLSEAFDHS